MTQVIQTNQPTAQAERQATLLNLSKLLLDEERLKILGALAQQPYSAATLTTQLAMGRVQLHLQKLEEAGLVKKRTEQGAERYQLDSDQIRQFKKLLFARDESNEAQTPADKDLAKFIKQNQIVQLPVNPAKLQMVLEWLVEKFQLGVAYPEKEVNELLKGHAIDHVTLRRLLIDHLLLVREAGIYQRKVSA